MKLNEAIPFIRFADLLTFNEERELCKTYDSRLLYVFRGKAQMVLDEKEYSISRGSLLVFAPNKPYFFVPHQEVKIIALDFDFTQRYAESAVILPPCPVALFDKAKVHEVPAFSDAPMFSNTIYIENASFLESKLKEIVQEFCQHRLFFRENGSSILKNILFEIVRYEKLGENVEKLVDRILSYIDEHIGEHITNSKIGEALYYSPNYLNRMMIRQTGVSLHRYILQRRLARATQLLLTTQKSISEIAASLGFYSASHFSNFFKQETGTSPDHYRKR